MQTGQWNIHDPRPTRRTAPLLVIAPFFFPLRLLPFLMRVYILCPTLTPLLTMKHGGPDQDLNFGSTGSQAAYRWIHGVDKTGWDFSTQLWSDTDIRGFPCSQGWSGPVWSLCLTTRCQWLWMRHSPSETVPKLGTRAT